MATPKYSLPDCEILVFPETVQSQLPGSTLCLLEMADRMSVEAIISKPLQPYNPAPFLHSAGILEQSMGARNRVGIGLSYRPAVLHRLAESIPWNRFLGFLKV
jgi:hypothetical protein